MTGEQTGWGVRERGAYSLWSPHAPAHWSCGCGCGRAGVCSCALLQPPAPPQPPPSAQGTPAAWALCQRQLRSLSSWHCPPSTTAQGTASPGSLSPLVSTARLSPGDANRGGVMPAPTLALGDSSLCCRPRTICGDSESVGRGAGTTAGGTCRGSPGTRCCWLSLCRPREFTYAETRSSEPSGASKHRKITQPWAGKPPPRCGEAPAPPAPTSLGHGNGTPTPQRCADGSAHIPSAQGLTVLGHPPPVPHIYIPRSGRAAWGPRVPRPPRPHSGMRRTRAQRAAAAQ